MIKKDYLISQVEAQEILRREGKDVGQERKHTTEVVLWEAVDEELDVELEEARQAIRKELPACPMAPWEREWKEAERYLIESLSMEPKRDRLPVENSASWLQILEKRRKGLRHE